MLGDVKGQTITDRGVLDQTKDQQHCLIPQSLGDEIHKLLWRHAGTLEKGPMKCVEFFKQVGIVVT